MTSESGGTMDVQIATRHMKVSDAFRALADEKARKLTRYEPRLIRVELLFETEAGAVHGEARAIVPGLPTFVARARSESARKALDAVMRKSARQLRDERSRRVDHRAPPAGVLAG